LARPVDATVQPCMGRVIKPQKPIMKAQNKMQ